jgi:hypothetical protein
MLEGLLDEWRVPNLGVVMAWTSRSLPPTWAEVSWKAGSAS